MSSTGREKKLECLLAWPMVLLVVLVNEPSSGHAWETTPLIWVEVTNTITTVLQVHSTKTPCWLRLCVLHNQRIKQTRTLTLIFDIQYLYFKNSCNKLQNVHIGHEGKVGTESGVVVVLWSRRLTELVVSPARNAAVALQRQRVTITRGDGDEVALYAVRRRLAVLVQAPARNIAVASKCQ